MPMPAMVAIAVLREISCGVCSVFKPLHLLMLPSLLMDAK